MPRQSSVATRRKVLVAAGALAALAAVLMIFFVVRISQSTSGDIKIGRETFEVGAAEPLARAIDRDRTPLLFQDLLQRDRDIWVQHVGSDPLAGWLAFEAKAPDQPRRCQLQWDRDRQLFTDPCTDRTYPADGAGLTQYPATVNDDDEVVVDLRTTPPAP